MYVGSQCFDKIISVYFSAFTIYCDIGAKRTSYFAKKPSKNDQNLALFGQVKKKIILENVGFTRKGVKIIFDKFFLRPS
jgi:hypothetical protein